MLLEPKGLNSLLTPTIISITPISVKKGGYPNIALMAYYLRFAYDNFCRIHKTLRVTPAMEAGITGSVWTLADLMATA
jgi:hypothetical protein